MLKIYGMECSGKFLGPMIVTPMVDVRIAGCGGKDFGFTISAILVTLRQ
jgi:hypothetical protein